MHTNQCVHRWTTTNNYSKIGCPYRYYTCKNSVLTCCIICRFCFFSFSWVTLTPFNNLSLPWTLSNVLKFVCVKNHKRSVNFDLNKSGASVSHLHTFFFHFIIFLRSLYNFQFVLFTNEILLYDLYYGQLFGIVSYKAIFFLQLWYLLYILQLIHSKLRLTM
jgi:hypothetical protein